MGAMTIEKSAREVEIGELVPWSMNPRKSMGDLESLTAAVREQGILQRLLVRPAADGCGGFEIICGERRWRAARAAGLAAVPVDVTEDLDDDTDALAACVAENMHREDVHPLEEADGIAAMRERCTVEEIAARLGRHVSYVYRRLALAGLCGTGRDALVAGQLTVAGAERLARVTDPDLQAHVDRREEDDLQPVRGPRARREAAEEGEGREEAAREEGGRVVSTIVYHASSPAERHAETERVIATVRATIAPAEQAQALRDLKRGADGEPKIDEDMLEREARIAGVKLEGHTDEDLVRLRQVVADPHPANWAGLAYSAGVLLARVAELEEHLAETGRSNAMACESPCGTCAGCLYADDVHGGSDG